MRFWHWIGSCTIRKARLFQAIHDECGTQMGQHWEKGAPKVCQIAAISASLCIATGRELAQVSCSPDGKKTK
ncbi:MAG TPA: hypothetical protein DHC76_01125 [Rhodobacteraceae bacterium]|jgi:hypothetical protein|nr:hypothetical protein [Paracoccaceae bacterium]